MKKNQGYMVGDIPDAIRTRDIIVVEVPEGETMKGRIRKKKTARKNSKSCQYA